MKIIQNQFMQNYLQKSNYQSIQNHSKVSSFDHFIKKQNKGMFASDSLKKIQNIDKKCFNLHHHISYQSSPDRSILSPQRFKKGIRRDEHFNHTTFKKIGIKPALHKNRHLRTQPYQKNVDQKYTGEHQQLTLSTQCSQNSSQKQQKRQKCLQQYQLVKLIGRGKFGSVFLSRHKQSGLLGALKIIQKRDILSLDHQSQQKMKQQLINQIKIQSFLSHPNLIQLYDFFYDQDRIYLFMQLGTDGHLLHLLSERGKLSQETTSIITRQIVEGVKYMHSQKVIHRDLKLQNIVFSCGMVKICDFGWSVYEINNFRSTICGTPLYLSPQILKGKKYNQKIDVWAIGTLAHEMVTGRNPFGIKKQEELTKIVKQNFQMKEGSLDLKNFISETLKKQPQRRPTSFGLLNYKFIQKYKQIQTAQQLFAMT